jgi:hypothetical protein
MFSALGSNVISVGEGGGGTSFSWDGDALNYFQVTGLSDFGQKVALNELILDLKYYNIWNIMQCIYPFVGGTAVLHKWNLKDPRDLDAAYRLTFTGSWTHSSTGALPSTAYANTFFNPSTNATNSGLTFGIYSRTNNTTGTQVYGGFDGSSITQHNISLGNMYNANILISYTVTRTDRLFINRRGALNDMQIYRDGLSLGTSTSNGSGNPNRNFYFGARNGAAAPEFYSVHELAFGFIGLAMTNQNAIDLTRIVNKYEATLGRNV